MISRIIYAAIAVIEGLIGLRFVLRLLGANPSNDFVHLIYEWSSPLVAPFAGMFGKSATVVAGPDAVVNSVFDWTALVAFVIYGILLAVIGLFLAPNQRISNAV